MTRSGLWWVLLLLPLGGMAHLWRVRRAVVIQLEALQAELGQLRRAIDEHAIVSATDVHGNIMEVNDKFTEISGYRRDELLGHNHRIVKSGEHGGDFFRAMWRTIARGKVWHGEIKNRRKNGGYYWTSATIVPFLNGKGKPEKYLSIRTDITSIKESQLKIDRLAYYDTLTELPNRRLFIEQLEREIKVAKRHNTLLALLFLDLDFFKEVNDTYGHELGDHLLREAALRISRCVRSVDLVSRLGGDEFTVILTDISHQQLNQATQRICQAIVHDLSQPFQLGLQEVTISVSVGVALFPDNGADSSSLIRNADRAMYAAKKQRAHHIFYSTLDESKGHGFDLANALRHAIANHELSIHYQPIVDLATGRMTKAEALLRWNNPTQGYIPPDLFIPIAEEYGMIHDIGLWLIHRVVEFVRTWREHHAEPLNIAINISPVQFERDIGSEMLDILSMENVPPSALTLEITEGVLLRHSEGIMTTLKQLRQEGVQLSIDDFGTGYSALSYLRSFEFDCLKIDRSFVKDMLQSQKSATIIEAVVYMVQRLGIFVIAEGVETVTQYQALKAYGCHLGQGYCFSPPLPAQDFEQKFAEQPQLIPT